MPTLRTRLRQVLGDFKQGWRATPLMTYFDWALSVALGIISLSISLNKAGTISIWYDEAWSYGVGSVPLSIIFRYVQSGYENMMLYFLFVHFWLEFAAFLGVQPNELYMRLPSIIAMALSVVVFYYFGRRFFGRVAGLVAATFYLLNYTVLYDAQQARAYAFEMLLVILSWYALMVAVSADKQSGQRARGWWLLYSVVTILCVYTHLFTLLVIGSQALAMGFLLVAPGPWRAHARSALKALIASFVAIGACSAPILWLAITTGDPNGWTPVPVPADIYTLLLTLTEGYVNMFLWYLVAGLIVLGVVVVALSKTSVISRMDGWKFALGSGRNDGKRSVTFDLAPIRATGTGISVVIFWLSGTILLSYVTSQKAIGQHFFYPRYENVALPALCLLIGIGVSSLRWRTAQFLVVVWLIVLLVQIMPYYYQQALITQGTPNYFQVALQQDYRTSALWLKAHYRAGDGIVCAGSYSCSIPMTYYLQVYPPSAAQFDANSPGAFFWATRHPVPTSPDVLARYTAQHSRIFVVVFGVEHHLTDPAVVATKQWYDTRYRQVGHQGTYLVSVYLYDTTTPLKITDRSG